MNLPEKIRYWEDRLIEDRETSAVFCSPDGSLYYEPGEDTMPDYSVIAAALEDYRKRRMEIEACRERRRKINSELSKLRCQFAMGGEQ